MYEIYFCFSNLGRTQSQFDSESCPATEQVTRQVVVCSEGLYEGLLRRLFVHSDNEHQAKGQHRCGTPGLRHQ